MLRPSISMGRRRAEPWSGRGNRWRGCWVRGQRRSYLPSGGTEADNLAVFGLVKAGEHIITSAIEHHAVLNACRHLEENGCEVTYIPVDVRGVVDAADVKRALRPNTKLISIMHANNETGVVAASRGDWKDCGGG